METRVCSICGIEQGSDRFYSLHGTLKDGTIKTYWLSFCKTCKAVKDKEHYVKNRGKRLRQGREWHWENREKVIARNRKNRTARRASRLLKERGITLEIYDEMFEGQKGLCAICGCVQKQTGKALCVDHNHTTNKVRGLLCVQCNVGLGYFKDSEERLLSAINYLKQHEFS